MAAAKCRSSTFSSKRRWRTGRRDDGGAMGSPVEVIVPADRRDSATGPLAAPLRVGLVIGQLSTGGAEGQLRLLCQGLDRMAVKPVVYCLSTHTDPYGALLERAGVPVRVISGGRIGRALRLRRALAADGIQLV